MKVFHIPLVSKILYIYSGPDEWEKFKKITIKEGVDIKMKSAACPVGGSGRTYGSWIWVYALKDRPTLIHELSHFIDSLMETLGTNSSEFRAYLTEWIMDTVLKWSVKDEKTAAKKELEKVSTGTTGL